VSEPGDASGAPSLDAAAARPEAAPPASRRRRLGCGLAALALLLAALGHWAWWYRARPHDLAPVDSRLLADAPVLAPNGALSVRLWIPFPHQNLGTLGAAVGPRQQVLAAAARLAGLPNPAIPRLGPFGIPPARELLIAASPDGRQVEASLRLYPAAALMLRLSGWLARNSWLVGGTVRLRGGPAEVVWEGWTWRLRAGLPADAGGATAGQPPARAEADRAPAFALVDLAAPSPPLPAGRYALRGEGADLVWRLGMPLAKPPQADPSPPVILVWVDRRPTPRHQAEALLILESEGGGLLAELPSAAAWAFPVGAMQVLPGGSILRQLTDVRPQPFGGGELAATDRAAGERARALAGTWLPLAAGESAPPLSLGGWLAVDPAATHAERLHRLLAELPLLGEEEAQRWGDVALVLRAAHGYRTLSCWLAADGSRGELRLHR
jgi:hypothetical protein